jgi:hypothetical protein
LSRAHRIEGHSIALPHFGPNSPAFENKRGKVRDMADLRGENIPGNVSFGVKYKIVGAVMVAALVAVVGTYFATQTPSYAQAHHAAPSFSDSASPSTH